MSAVQGLLYRAGLHEAGVRPDPVAERLLAIAPPDFGGETDSEHSAPAAPAPKSPSKWAPARIAPKADRTVSVGAAQMRGSIFRRLSFLKTEE